MSLISDRADRLVELLRSLGSCAVAFSGGVDSTVVAKAARLALGDNALAVTGVSASLAQGELDAAAELARSIGVRHETLNTAEFDRPEYVRNAPDRCFHCKTELYSRMTSRREGWGVDWIVSGANQDDLGDYRPGLQAAADHAVRHPLAELRLTKSDVREIAKAWSLPVWDKPAAPCLSSRVAYGEEVTPERLARIDAAERWLRERSLPEVRVRWHRGELARLEVPVSALPALVAEPFRGELVAELRRLGFQFVSLDLEGFRSGSLNRLVTLTT